MPNNELLHSAEIASLFSEGWFILLTMFSDVLRKLTLSTAAKCRADPVFPQKN